MFIADYVLMGKHKREWRAKFADAKQVALNACRLISQGEQISLKLTNTDRMAYLRATEALSSVRVKLDVAAQEYASAVTLLGHHGTITEACRAWVPGRPDEDSFRYNQVGRQQGHRSVAESFDEAVRCSHITRESVATRLSWLLKQLHKRPAIQSFWPLKFAAKPVQLLDRFANDHSGR
jgi:hypothetical protein